MNEPHIHNDQKIHDVVQRARSGEEADIAAARAYLEAELRAQPDAYPALDAEAEVLTLAGDSTLATRLLEEYIRYYPQNTDASARLAWVHWNHGDERDEALAEIKAAVARDPSNTRARWWTMQWLEATKDFISFRKFAQDGILRDPDNKYLNLMSARASVLAKDEPAAISAFTEALRIDAEYLDARLAFAEFLISSSKFQQAMDVLSPAMAGEKVPAEVRIKAAAAFFGMKREADGYAQLSAVLASRGDQNAERLARFMKSLYLLQPSASADQFLFGQLEHRQLGDDAASMFAQTLAERPGFPSFAAVFSYVSLNSKAYPKTMGWLLSAPGLSMQTAGAVSRWIGSHPEEIGSNTELWGNVGKFLVARKRWVDAILHLEHYEGRPGVKPWMILLYVRALEAVDRFADANRHSRRALLLPADISEAGIRSRLAFNLALEDLSANAKVIVMDISRKGKEAARADDVLRMIAVESFAGAARINTFELRKELFDEANRCAKEIVQRDDTGDAAKVLTRYRQKVIEILSRSRA